MTRLGAFCDRLLEAGWLGAVASVPLYFNLLSNRIFEPDKTTVLRAIVTVMVLAQLVKWEESVRADGSDRPGDAETAMPVGWRRLMANPLALPALAVLSTWLLATAVSITPAMSFWGSYERAQGSYTMLSYVLLFFLVALNLRRRAQVERLFTVMLLASLPISLYAVAQHFHLDPLSWGSDTSTRVTSTMGNAIFLAAYLIMVVPITLARFVRSTRSLRDFGKAREASRGGGRVAALAGILVAGVLVQSVFGIATRENLNAWWAFLPLIGLLVAAGTLFTIPRPTFLTVLAESIGCFLLLALQLAALFLTGSRGPWIGLLAGLVFFAIATTARTGPRWLPISAAGLGGLVLALLVLLNLPSVTQSPLVRDVPFFSRLSALADPRVDTVRVRLLIWQGTWDLLTRRPPIGFAADDPLGPARLLFGYGPESMFVAYYKVYPPELGHLESRNASPDRNHNDLLDNLVGEGILGLAAYLFLLFVAFRLIWRQLRRVRDLGTHFTLAALGGVLVAHFVESLSGIVVAASREYLWVSLAILASGVLWREDSSPAAATTTTRFEAAAGPPRIRPLAGLAVLVLVATAVLQWTPALRQAQIGMILAFGGLVVALVAASIAMGGSSASRFCRTSRLPIYILATLAAGGIVVVNLNALAADIYFKRGLVSDRERQFGNSVIQYQEALKLAGDQDRYLLYLGRAYLELAAANKQLNAPISKDLFEASRAALEQARDLYPLNADHYMNLARLYRVWGYPDDLAKLDQAAEYYRQATVLNPHVAHLYDEWGQFELSRGDLDAALDKAQRAMAIDPEFEGTFVLIGDIYLTQRRPQEALAVHRKALSLNPAALSDSEFERRLASYERFEMLPEIAAVYAQVAQAFPRSPDAHTANGNILLRQNRPDEARSEFESSARLAPSDWTVYRNLALFFEARRMTAEALASARETLHYAPPDQAAAVQSLIDRLARQ